MTLPAFHRVVDYAATMEPLMYVHVCKQINGLQTTPYVVILGVCSRMGM